jgi:hypothetical protein
LGISLKKDSSGVSPLKSTTGIIFSDNTNKANILNSQFSSVFNQNEDDNFPDLGDSNIPDMPQITVCPAGVEKLLKSLKDHKASGPDDISPRLLKHLAPHLAPVLTLLYRATLKQGTIPDEWRTAHVVPIFKKGDKHKAENYRPVSLTSIVCKIMEHIMCSNILKHLDAHDILTDVQHGFRKRRSCETQLILTLNDLAKNIDESGQTDVILLDFAKAFDKVPHRRLLKKLEHYGIRHQNNTWIKSFLHDRSQKVLVEGTTSSTAPVKSGVPQGSVLGPLLFLIFINDLPSRVSNGTSVKLFADDCVLYRRITSPDDCVTLQSDLDSLQRWEKEWLMQFHPSKCLTLHITNKKKPIKTIYKIHGEDLSTVQTAKYLGVNINSKLSWNDHIAAITKKAHNTIGFLQRNISCCPKATKALSYKTLVRPLVEYSSVVWDPHTKQNINIIEKVQRRGARFVCGDYRRASSVDQMLSDLEWTSLAERRAKAKVTMMYKIVNQLVDIPANLHLRPSPRFDHKFVLPFARINSYQRSFFVDGVRLWNKLTDNIRASASLDIFKRQAENTTVL